MVFSLLLFLSKLKPILTESGEGGGGGVPRRLTVRISPSDGRIYEAESIIIRTVCFIFIKTRAEILQLHNFSTQSPCFTTHSVHHRTICFMASEYKVLG